MTNSTSLLARDEYLIEIHQEPVGIVLRDMTTGCFISYEDALQLRDYLNQYLQLGQELITQESDICFKEFWQADDQPPPVKETKIANPGYVYLLRSEAGQYKIGKTSAPENRLRVFSVKLPFRVEFACLIETDDMAGLEKELHQRFNAKRIDGEWFALDPKDIDYIRGLAK